MGQHTRYTFHDEEKNHLKEIFHVKDTLSNILEGKYMSYYINGNLESSGYFSNNETIGKWEFFYETGKPKMRGVLQNNSSDGYWEYFYENGNKSMEGEVGNQKRQGEWKIYYESGALKEKGPFKDNKQEGLWKHYYEDGNLKGEIDYTYGKGRYTEYYPTGEKRTEGPRSDVKNVGIWKYYYKDGSLQAEGQYENGRKSGLWKYYHHNGQLSAVGEFNKGEANGEWIYYHENGVVSSKGKFEEGKKSGYWGLFYEDGSLKGEGKFNNGSGMYKEFFKSGKVKLKGPVVDGKNHGTWKYYYEGGDLEGECEFANGRGEYYGYYPDGTLQTKGIIDDGKKIGKWELYKNDGSLSGYYKPIYDDTLLKKEDMKVIRETKKYGVADFRFRGRKFKYFESRINEYQGVIMSFNPLLSLIGKVPFGFEFYMQERLGHEFEFMSLRDPFYTEDNNVPMNEVYNRGYEMAIKQKFYNPGGNFGLWYFGHEIRFSNISHFANVNHVQVPDNVIRASASEQKIEYSVLLGYRLMQNTYNKGFTADAFVGLGSGYRSFDVEEAFVPVFDELSQEKVPLTFSFGLNLGYNFSFGSRGKK